MIDRELLEVCKLAYWWGTPRDRVAHVVRYALGSLSSPNYNPRASDLLKIVPLLRTNDQLSVVLCDLGWTGCEHQVTMVDGKLRERKLSLELLRALVRTRPCYDDPDWANAASTLAETMKPAVALRGGEPSPREVLEELERCVRILMANEATSVAFVSH